MTFYYTRDILHLLELFFIFFNTTFFSLHFLVFFFISKMYILVIYLLLQMTVVG